MKTILATFALAAATLFATADTAHAQWGYYGGSVYGYSSVRPNYNSGAYGGPGYGYVNPNAGSSNSGAYGGPGYGYVNPNAGFSYSAYGYSYPAPVIVPYRYSDYYYPGYYRSGYYSFFR